MKIQFSIDGGLTWVHAPQGVRCIVIDEDRDDDDDWRAVHISHSDRSDPVYKWKKGYAAPAAPAPTGPLYTCIGKGGRYELLGTVKGAGEMKGFLGHVYRDVATSQIYVRNFSDFDKRMEKIE